jgi:hypothetical protein
MILAGKGSGEIVEADVVVNAPSRSHLGSEDYF